MSHSSLLRVADVHALYRLVGECRELGDDPHEWRRHWFGRLGELTGSALVLGGDIAEARDGQLVIAGTSDWGWENGLDKGKWIEVMIEHGGGSVTDFPQFAAYFRRQGAGDGQALSRKDLLTDREWYRHWAYQDAFAGIGIEPQSGIPGVPRGPQFRRIRTQSAETARSGESIRFSMSP